MWPANDFADMLRVLMTTLLCVSQTVANTIGRRTSQQTLADTLLRQGHFPFPDNANTPFNQNSNSAYGVPHQTIHSSAAPPWSCDCDYFWRDLGDRFYPRYVKDGNCRSRTCVYGHYSCVPFRYPVKVLKRLHPTEEGDDGYRHSLGEEYTFVTVNVTVNCMCGRSVVHQEQ